MQLLSKTLLVAASAASLTMSAAQQYSSAIQRAIPVFVTGPLLNAVQTAQLFNDSKTFVDMPMKADPEVVLAAFANLTAAGNATKAQLTTFVDQYFAPVGSDVINGTAPDYQVNPPILATIKDTNMSKWASDLNNLWPTLVRTAAPEVALYPQRHSLLPRRYNVVVPGGRFRESYYWDSYWVVKGLLVCNMGQTALGLVSNLLDDVDAYGFVPNGGRIYYLTRSQPPLLSNMVTELLTSDALNATAKSDLLTRALPTLEREYTFWMTERSVKLQGGHVLNRYFQGNASATPRPESYSEDVKTAAGNTTVYSEIRAGAESGWDFSSRQWLPRNGTLSKDLSALGLADNQLARILPVELNAYLYNMERQLASMSTQQGNFTATAFYYSAAARRAKSMQATMWDDSASLWRDVVLGDQVLQQSPSVTAACFIPLWAGPQFLKDSNNTASADAFLTSLQQSNLTGPGGIMTSTNTSGQQWDRPNVWPPLQWLVVEGMRALGTDASVQKADQLAKQWLSGVYTAWLADGVMHEKYNGLEPGVYGKGGEYSAQVGFGWTNGVTLDWIRRYYSTSGNSTASN